MASDKRLALLERRIKHAEENLKTQGDRQKAIARIGQRALSGIGLTELLDETVVLLAGVFAVEYTAVFELFPNHSAFLLRSGLGWSNGTAGKAQVSTDWKTHTGYCLRTNASIVFQDLDQDSRFQGPRLLSEHAVRSGISVLIHGKNLPYGLLGIYSIQHRQFTDEDVHFLESIANLLAIAIERKEAEETSREIEGQLRQSQKMEAIGRLAGGIAHDFNNLLTALSGYSTLVLNSLEHDDPRRADMEEIRSTVNRAAALTRQLLIFSRKQPVQPVVLSLNPLISNIEKMIRRLIGDDIQFAVSLKAEPSSIRADANQMEQVLMNLAVNARDAMPQGGKLTIETANTVISNEVARRHSIAHGGPYVQLLVQDTGCGMNAEVLSHLFEPFFTTKEQGKGTGLGLSTVYGIVKQFQGFIEVASRSGCGTTFKLYFPLAMEKIQRPEKKMAVKKMVSGSETILFVEDDPAVRSLSHRVLLSHGYKVIEAPNGVEALKRFKECPDTIDLLLTDIAMPGLGGTALAEQLSSKRPTLKILFSTGHAEKLFPAQMTQHKDPFFLPKPYSPEELIHKVREILDHDSTGDLPVPKS